MHYRCFIMLSALWVCAWNAAALAPPPLPRNLAPEADIAASSVINPSYEAKFVADGQIPVQNSQADTGQAWAVDGETHRSGGEIRFAWPAPVTLAELFYYGRTAWGVAECWRDYAVYLDDAADPAIKGSFEMRDGPQRIVLPEPQTATSLRMVFSSSYNGPNPGASEIQIFSETPSDAALAWWASPMRLMPWVDHPQPEAVRALIERLAAAYGDAYHDAAAHRARLDAADEDLAALQRDVLLFDVDDVLAIRRFEIVASHVYTYHYEGFHAGGGLYVANPRHPDREPRELVASPTGQILDCDLSYDGATALFSWRQTESEGYHLWTIRTDGSDLRQLTGGDWHDYNACWLPDGGIAFLSTRAPQFAYCWYAPVGVVYRMDADGGNVQRLSANYLNDFTPYPLEDGRIIFTRWEYVDRPAIPIQSLWTIAPDGSGLTGYFGNRVLSPATFMDTRPIPGTTKIVCTMTGHNGPTRGAIGVVDRARGDNVQEAIENITPDVPVPRVNEGCGNTDGTKQYSCPIPLDAERLLLSAQGPALVRTFSGECQATALPMPSDGMQWFCTQPIRPRPRPPVLPNTRTDSEPMATLYLQDLYRGLEPTVARGEVKRLRVVREMEKTVRIDASKRAFGFQFPVISCGATYAAKDVLGEIPVEADGSAYFRVPSGMPLYFMALDADGRAVQRMRTFTHFMPGENQSCIGCHEPRNSSAAPGRGAAMAGAPRDLEAPEWGRGGFSYPRVVQPVLDAHCTGCHNPTDPPKGLDLTGDITDYFSVSYENLAREPQGPQGSPYVSWIPTYNGQEQNILQIAPKTWGSPRSKLAEVVLSGHPDADGTPRIALSDAERRRIFAWIDLNVPYYDSSETAYPEREGCRRMYPEDLDKTLRHVAHKRCAQCHDKGEFPRKEWVRVARPEYNAFLMAPLPKEAGGSGKCGAAVFASKDDEDYQKILKTFEPIATMLQETPRMDMPGAKPAPHVCRACK